MEFEESKPVNEDVILAAAPKVTIQPFHSNIKIDHIDYAPTTSAAQHLDFDSESTTAAAISTAPLSKTPHRFIAAIIAAFCMTIFAGGVAAIYFTR